MKQAKRGDGFYAWRITGPLARLTFTPAAGGAASSGSPRSQGAARANWSPPPPRPATPAPAEEPGDNPSGE
jgi:hypothetical protein